MREKRKRVQPYGMRPPAREVPMIYRSFYDNHRPDLPFPWPQPLGVKHHGQRVHLDRRKYQRAVGWLYGERLSSCPTIPSTVPGSDTLILRYRYFWCGEPGRHRAHGAGCWTQGSPKHLTRSTSPTSGRGLQRSAWRKNSCRGGSAALWLTTEIAQRASRSYSFYRVSPLFL